VSIKGWWARTKDWLASQKGRVRALFAELPDAAEVLAEIDAESLLHFGDAAAAIEPQDNKLLRAMIKLANLLDFIAPVSGIGGDKERALLAKFRQIAQKIGWVDDQIDTFWTNVARPELVRFIERKKAFS